MKATSGPATAIMNPIATTIAAIMIQSSSAMPIAVMMLSSEKITSKRMI